MHVSIALMLIIGNRIYKPLFQVSTFLAHFSWKYWQLEAIYHCDRTQKFHLLEKSEVKKAVAQKLCIYEPMLEKPTCI